MFKASNEERPPHVGLGLRSDHYHEVLETKPSEIEWFEIHSENFFDEGGYTLKVIDQIREYYQLSLHGVGLSLATADDLDIEHLKRLKVLDERYQPFLISEHLSWGHVNRVHIPDLLPVPYTKEALEITCKHIEQTQDFLGRHILIENPSSYVTYKHSEMLEQDFLIKMVKSSGAKILLDINNVFVSAKNHNFNAKTYLDAIPIDLIGEIHLAGHSVEKFTNGDTVYIDTHDNLICDEVWELYDHMAKRGLKVPTLLEWDQNIPSLQTLITEISRIKVKNSKGSHDKNTS